MQNPNGAKPREPAAAVVMTLVAKPSTEPRSGIGERRAPNGDPLLRADPDHDPPVSDLFTPVKSVTGRPRGVAKGQLSDTAAVVNCSLASESSA